MTRCASGESRTGDPSISILTRDGWLDLLAVIDITWVFDYLCRVKNTNFNGYVKLLYCLCVCTGR